MERLKIFAKTVENEATEQIYKMAKSEAYNDCIIRIMPDCHAGKGCTVGTVIEVKDRVVPNSVGVDIGCGMLVAKIGKVDIDFALLDEKINKLIPSGFASHNPPKTFFDKLETLHCVKNIDLANAMKQIGTLGGGNHFIEVDVDNDNNKYLVIHSGSRHLGVEVCNYYQNIAYKSLNEMGTIKAELIARLKSEGRAKDIEKEWKMIQKPKCDKELSYLQGEMCERYLHDMSIVQEYASLNRRTMALIIANAMGWRVKESFETIHNYIDVKNKILRKGAVNARADEKLIIPINMRDGSLICVGKGNEDWLCSAPHGAGRLMSRSKAKETLSIEEFTQTMSNVYSTCVCQSTLDEAPMAYKPIDEIIECIEPTVNIIKRIKPIYNFKAK